MTSKLGPWPARIGSALLLEHVSWSNDDETARALWRGPDGAWWPAFVRRERDDETPDGAVELTTRLRLALGEELSPPLLAAYGRDRRVLVSVEEDVGGLDVRQLFGRPDLGDLRLPSALHAARQVATAFHRLATRAPGQTMVLSARRVRFGWDGRARVLGHAANAAWPRDSTPNDALVVDWGPKIDWLSPEAVRGEARAPAHPIYVVGLMLFEAITGTVPFPTGNALRFVEAVLDIGVPRLATVRPSMPPAVIQLVDRCTAAEPAERFASWPALFSALADAEASAPAFDPRPLAALLASLPERAAVERLHAGAARGTFDGLDPGPLASVDVVPLGPRAEDTLTAPLPWLTRRGQRVKAETWGADARPMVRVRGLLIDARVVTAAEYARFVIATARAAPAAWGARVPPRDVEDAPVTGITLADAEAYAAWAGKRVPESDEWERAVLEAGARVRTGEVWELTTERFAADAWVVRGGRWRDVPDQPPRPGNLSHSGVAVDVGFRCVADV